MIHSTHVSELKNKTGQQVIVQGFVHTLRVQSKIIFLILRDTSGLVQNIIEISTPEVLKWRKTFHTNQSFVSLVW